MLSRLFNPPLAPFPRTCPEFQPPDGNLQISVAGQLTLRDVSIQNARWILRERLFLVLAAIALCFAGLLILIVGAKYFIDGIALIVEVLGVPPLVIGMTLVANSSLA